MHKQKKKSEKKEAVGGHGDISYWSKVLIYIWTYSRPSAVLAHDIFLNYFVLTTQCKNPSLWRWAKARNIGSSPPARSNFHSSTLATPAVQRWSCSSILWQRPFLTASLFFTVPNFFTSYYRLRLKFFYLNINKDADRIIFLSKTATKNDWPWWL